MSFVSSIAVLWRIALIFLGDLLDGIEKLSLASSQRAPVGRFFWGREGQKCPFNPIQQSPRGSGRLVANVREGSCKGFAALGL